MSAPFVDLPRPVVRGRRGVVSCGHPLGVGAALEMLVDGGNAVDAACAAAAALCVVLPNACGLGGDALILIGRRDGGSLAINGTGAAPAAVSARIPADGGGTAAVPGLVAALMGAHEQEGRLPRERVLAPAVGLASDGFPVGEDLLAAIQRQRARLERGSASWALADPRLRAGDAVRLPRLAGLLEAIAADGTPAFYAGAAAEAIAAAVRADGGAMQPSDLHAYTAPVGAPVSAVYAGVSCETSPPTSQGILLLVALRWLDRLKGSSGETSRLHQQVRAIEECFVFRSDVAREDAAARLLADAVLDEMSLEPSGRSGTGPRGYHHTTSIAVADAEGLVVSALISVFDDFGSAVLVPELDMVLNNRLLGFDAEGPNGPAPGRRPVHTLSPALVRSSEGLTAVATPGADGQIQTLLQVLSAVHEDGAPLQEALHRPRWRVVDGSVALEEGFDQELAADLEARGHSVTTHPAGDELFGAVAAATSHAGPPGLTAASDPRRETWAGAV